MFHPQRRRPRSQFESVSFDRFHIKKPRFQYPHYQPPCNISTSQFLPIRTPLVQQLLDSNAVSSLLSSLLAQGLISLTKESEKKDYVVLMDFDPIKIKIRYESVISALYADIPRQCTSCGLRFKCQEDHSKHMDEHVIKNRAAKNPKKIKLCRNWFVSANMWLLGTQETDPVFSKTNTTNAKKKDDEKDLAVPADVDQTVCELCGELFVEFYNHDADDWMYKGTIYLNAPPGSIQGLDKSQLGPIVHVKCKL